MADLPAARAAIAASAAATAASTTVAAASTAIAATAAATVTVAAAALAAAVAFAAFTGGRADRLGVALTQLRHRRLARQLDAALVVDEEDLDLHFLAHLDDVADAVDVLVAQLRHVAQPVGLGRDLDERAEILDRHDAAVVDLADLHLGGHRLDDVAAALGRRAVDRRDVHGAVVLDVDVGAGVGLQGFDVLAARADDLADLLGVDADREQARGPLADLRARRRQGGGHLLEDDAACFLRAVQRVADDLVGDALGLDVELDRGDPVARAADLEVHVAEVIFLAHDVGEQLVLLAFLHEADRNARDGLRDGHARVHQGQRPAAARRHRARTVALEDVTDDADGVGEHVDAGEHRDQ